MGAFIPTNWGKVHGQCYLVLFFLIYNDCLLASKTNFVILDIYTQHFCVTASSGYVVIAEDPATIATFQSAAIYWATHLSLQGWGSKQVGGKIFGQTKHHCSWHPKWYFMHSQHEVIFYHFIVWPDFRVVVLIVSVAWSVIVVWAFYVWQFKTCSLSDDRRLCFWTIHLRIFQN